MKLLATAVVLFFMSVSAFAQGPKPCEELKAEIAKKLEAKEVKAYSLDIVEKDKQAEGQTVGTCDGGTKKIVYRKTSDPTRPAETKKP
jgi:hypothetical protein